MNSVSERRTVGNTVKLVALLFSLIALWAVSAAFHAMVVWLIAANLAAVRIMMKEKAPRKKELIAGIILGLSCVPASLIVGVSVVLPYLASMAVFRSRKNKICLLQNGKSNCVAMTIALIVVAGGALGGVNLLLAMGQTAVNPGVDLSLIFGAIQAGVFEEILFRLFFFALCVSVTGDQPLSRVQNTLCYAVMVIPHVLLHFNFATFDLGNLMVLTLLFGIPFAWMQRKVNLVSAMGSHAVVDIVRACILGV